MHETAAIIALILGRLLLGGLFVVGGIHHFFLVVPLTNAIEARGIPLAKWVLFAGTTFQLIAGTLLIGGLFVAPAALGLAAFTAVASIMLLDFWNMEGIARDHAVNGWQLNLAVIGGLLIAAASTM
ncbi:DoxX family protein [Rhizobium sp. Root1220]|uniref:DoxX family protein n=1 Tax=Rhizobium sp. Root1220 TaxID=1736432 RepID=UPI00070056A4|nr:DoxX family protein [Rhizobium sp. Root1220]KQV66087.1 quinol oxidase [Rhizobium sp. Root1220]